jgi:hypothetical protein
VPDRPTTLSIDPRRWRMLFADNMQVTAAFMAEHGILSLEDLHKLLGMLDEAKLMATAWYKAGQPKIENEMKPMPPAIKRSRGRPPGSGKKQRLAPRIIQ